MRKALAGIVILGFLLSGCGQALPPSDGKIHVVSSSGVWADIAQAVGGKFVSAGSVIKNPQQDPHSFQPSVRDQLEVDRADLLIENGTGYDSFFSSMVSQSKSKLLVVSDLSGIRKSSQNPHLWYSLTNTKIVTKALVSIFSQRDPAHAGAFEANASKFNEQIGELVARERALSELPKQKYLAPETVADYLMADCGFDNLTPNALSLAVMNETDVPAEVLLKSRQLLASGKIQFFVSNAQTETTQTNQLQAFAAKSGVTVLEFSEQLPAGESYLSWLGKAISLLEKAAKK